MIENRSVPANELIGHVVYEDLAQAIRWLNKAFGFAEHFRYGDRPDGAQMHLGNAWIVVRTTRGGELTPAKLGYGTQSLSVFVDDVDGHYQRAKAAGAKIVEEPHETEYGEYQYAALDLDGHHWVFARHAHDRSPEEWGAKMVEPAYRLALLRRPRFCYVEIPATDLRAAADFYEKVFGWNIRHRDTARPSFDDATGNISGAWVKSPGAAREPGLMTYIWVDSVDATLAKVKANGGAVVEETHQDSPDTNSWIAKFRDPAGNLIGLYQEGRR
jgi:predicted enzyme related to lactoylglutathione lyase